MNFFAILLSAAVIGCVAANDTTDLKKVEENYLDNMDEVQKKYSDMVSWVISKFNDVVDDLSDMSAKFPECGAAAQKELSEAKDEVVAEMRKRKNAMQAELKKEHDEAVKNIKEEQEKEQSLSAWFKSFFASIYQTLNKAFWDAAAMIVEKANEFLEFRAVYTKKVNVINDKFQECISKLNVVNNTQ